MQTLLTHTSALQLIRNNPELVLQARTVSYPKQLTSRLDAASAEKIAAKYKLALPLCVHAPTLSQRYTSKNVRRYVLSDLPSGSGLIEAESGLLAFSPLHVPAQLSRTLGFVRLIMLCYEFCGTYSINAREEFGFSSHDPFVTVKRWGEYCDQNAHLPGMSRLKRALSFVQDGSASPRETKTAMLLTLPWRMGGYGLRPPSLNHTVTVRNANGQRAVRRCDLYWSDYKLAVEYDSNLAHTGAERIARDSRRRDQLLEQGIRVMTITSAQLEDADEMHALAKTLRRALGMRTRRTDDAWALRNARLRKELCLDRGR